MKTEKGKVDMKKATLIFEPSKIEIIRFIESDLIQTSGGSLDFDGDGGNTGAPDDGWV